MANRYWVGGTASWDGTAGTKWAASNGGPGGQTVPTTADDVFFTSTSGAVTVTIATGNTGAKSINCTGFTGTITGTATITVAGSITLDAGMTYTHTSYMTISGSGTITTAGKSTGGYYINGAGITVGLGDALTVVNNANALLEIGQGTFNTNNYNVTLNSNNPFLTSSANAKTVNFGSSTISITNAGFTIGGSNLTFNAGTSQINLSNSGPIFAGGGKTFYNVSFTNTTAGTRSITGTNTFNDLSLTASATGLSQLSLAANQTVNGTFTCSGSSAIQRGFVKSDTIGTSRTITAATLSANDCDFRDITIAGGAAGTSPTRAGDCGGNSGITFPSPKTVYWNLSGSQNWNSTGWATTSTGSPSANNFPLAQDTATFTDDGSAGTVALNTYNFPTLNASGRTSAMTLNYNAGVVWYGSHTLGSGVTVSGTQTQTFSGRSTMTFTSAGKTITYDIIIDAPSGEFKLGDAFVSTATGIFTVTRGTFNAANYNFTCLKFSATGSNTRTVTMGSGLWTISGTAAAWDATTTTGLTFNKDTANILLSDTSTTARTFSGGSLTYNKLTIGGTTGTSITTLNGACSFSELASTKTVAHTIRLSSNLGTITTWSVTGTSGNVVTMDSNSAGTRRTFSLTNVTSGIDYLAVKDIGVNQTNKFYVGANSTDNGNNLNVYFTASPSVAAKGNMFMLFN